MLDLGGERQPHRALAPFEQVRVPAVGDDDVRQRVRGQRDLLHVCSSGGAGRATPARRWLPRGWSPARTAGPPRVGLRLRPFGRPSRGPAGSREGHALRGFATRVRVPAPRSAMPQPDQRPAAEVRDQKETSEAPSASVRRSARMFAAAPGDEIQTAASSPIKSNRAFRSPPGTCCSVDGAQHETREQRLFQARSQCAGAEQRFDPGAIKPAHQFRDCSEAEVASQKCCK